MSSTQMYNGVEFSSESQNPISSQFSYYSAQHLSKYFRLISKTNYKRYDQDCEISSFFLLVATRWSTDFR